MDKTEDNQGFKVKDNRRFDAEGNEVKGTEVNSRVSSETAKVASRAAIQSDKPAKEEEAPRPGSPEEITFTSFVMSLATQALMLLGEIKPPPGANIGLDPMAAKHTIDILTMLQDKTKGNLDDNERYLIEEVLHNLRMSFVRNSR